MHHAPVLPRMQLQPPIRVCPLVALQGQAVSLSFYIINSSQVTKICLLFDDSSIILIYLYV